MTQRILDPGEIQALDPSAIPRVRLPERNTHFGNPRYNLKREMELRLAALRGESASVKP